MGNKPRESVVWWKENSIFYLNYLTILQSYILLKILRIPFLAVKICSLRRKSLRKGEHVVFSWILLHELSLSLRFLLWVFSSWWGLSSKVRLVFRDSVGKGERKLEFACNQPQNCPNSGYFPSQILINQLDFFFFLLFLFWSALPGWFVFVSTILPTMDSIRGCG